MNGTHASRYRARFRVVLEYIEVSLNEPLDVERLSGVPALSTLDFHWPFSSLFGNAVLRYSSPGARRCAFHR
jgi:hypothetical protein